MTSEIAYLEQRFGRVEVIENETMTIPGSINTFQLRAQDPHGPFSGPMLALVSGRYPTGADEVAVTSGVASAFHLRVGDTWRRRRRRPAGSSASSRIPRASSSEFALVAPGQVQTPTQVVALFDAPGVPLGSIKAGTQVQTPASVARSNPLNPETISLAALVLGMLLIALVSVGGFTVLAQRRLRSIGMLESIGATDRHVRLVVGANGAVVGLVGAVLGFVLGLVVWLAYRPSLEQSAHHVIGVFALPWVVVAAAMVLAVVAAFFAASRPARAITRVPIVAALSGRPAPPRQVHRSAIPGIVLLVAAFLLLGYSGGTNSGNGSGGAPELVLRDRAPHSRTDPARAVLPLAHRQAGPARADRAPPGATRPRPLPGTLGFGAGGDQPRRPRRGDRHARRRRPLRQRLRLRGSEPRLEPARAPRQHAATAGDDPEGTERQPGRPAAHDDEAATPTELATQRRLDRQGSRCPAHRPRDARTRP